MTSPERADATVEVRRRGPLFGTVGVAAGALAAAYLARAAGTGEVLDWVLAGVLAALALAHLALLVDARSPLFVADARGVRLRRGRTWTGLTWGEVAAVDLVPNDGLLRDGRLAVVAAEAAATTGRAGGSVPLGLTTRVIASESDLAGALEALAGRDVCLAAADASDEEPEPARTGSGSVTRFAARLRDPRPVLATGIGTLAGRLRPVATGESTPVAPLVASATPSPLRAPRRATRTDVVLTEGALAVDPLVGDEVTAPIPLPEVGELRRGDDLDLDLTEALVLPVPDPVIGPELLRARARLRLSVAELAERTRIRVHVIEAMERDDFSACGGDFYARGHLRTLARVLGLDSAPLLASYDARYAAGPVSPREVFTADPSRAALVRETRDSRPGPRWSVLVAVLMAVVLAWSVARLVIDGPVPVDRTPGLGAGSGGVHSAGASGRAVPVLLRAPGGGAHVVVRDGNGRIVFTGDLAFGATRSLSVLPPVRVESSDGSVAVVVNGEDRGALGDIGRPASGVFDGG